MLRCAGPQSSIIAGPGPQRGSEGGSPKDEVSGGGGVRVIAPAVPGAVSEGAKLRVEKARL